METHLEKKKQLRNKHPSRIEVNIWLIAFVILEKTSNRS